MEFYFQDKSNKTWSNKVNVNNISNINSKLFNKYRINNTNGTTIINFFENFYNQDINCEELEFYIKKFYYKSLINGLQIKITNNLLVEKIEYNINSSNNIDVLAINKIKENLNLGCYINSTIECFHNKEKDIYCYIFKIVNYHLGKTIIDKSKFKKYIHPHINQTIPRNFIDNLDLDGWLKIGEFKLNLSFVTQSLVEVDKKLMANAVGKSNSSEYTGLYFERNNRILSKPISVWNLRNTQSGNYWRSILIWKNNKELDNLIKPQLNKSQLNPQNVEKTLFRGISLFIKGFYDQFYKKIIEEKIKLC